MHALEKELGAVLFHRTGRGMTLTSAGHGLLGPARRILRETRQAEAAVSADPRRSAPRLDIAVLPPALNGPLAEVLAAFLRANPGTVVHVHELGSEQEAVDVLASGTAEIVATRLPLDIGRAGDRLATLPLGTYDVYVAHPPAAGEGGPAPARPGPPVGVTELHDVPLVLMPPRPILSAGMEALIEESGPQLVPRAVVGQQETRTAWMLEGIAATLLGARRAAEAARCGARFAPLRGVTGLTVGLAWDPRTASPVARLFAAAAYAAATRSPAAPAPPASAAPGGGPARPGGTPADPGI
ncbi:DNA-binding transcriptional LysR family regulator [Actinomadura algeriensis]|uniref:DNA-binding transcriptional LysR family regulator n=1 Tax=Actinomadura algeriensis TaxID=1679523 RepID=A0ABR9K1W3_9ACTN|nr:DNA-binding transcriptional LysR family regulator [Actinomadura algeriensis]